MKIVVHPGLPGSGAGALQRYLGRTFAADAPAKCWYPRPQRDYPGHTVLANRLVDPSRRAAGLQSLRGQVESAERAGTETLLLSADEFSLLDAEGLAGMRDAFKRHALHLVFAVAPLAERAVTRWTESVRRRQVRALDSSIADWRLDPGTVGRLADALVAERCTVLVRGAAPAPSWPVAEFLRAAGIPQPDSETPDSLPRSRTPALVEIEIIRHLNTCFRSLKAAGIEVNERFIRNQIARCLASARWRETIPEVPIAPSPDCAAMLRAKALQETDALAALAQSGKVALVGELASLRGNA